jgi:hypothetical protein
MRWHYEKALIGWNLGRFIMGHFFGRSVPVEHGPEEANFSDDVFRILDEFHGEILFWYIVIS